ncbi:MAG: DNRLRE domain-containing protein [bacterium]
MSIRIISPLIILFILVVFNIISCSEDMPIQDINLADPSDRGSIENISINTIDLEVSFSDTVAATGSSEILSLGSYTDIETKILLRFENLPNNILATSAAIVLNTRAIIGESMQPFTATIHQITADWDELSVTDEIFQNSFNIDSLGSAEIFPTVNDTSGIDTLNIGSVRIEFDNPQLVNDWMDSTSMVANYGVLLDFLNSNFIKEFFSKDNITNQPMLEIQYLSDSTDTDTTYVTATADAYLVRSLMEPPSGPLYVDNIFSRQSVIKFDLSKSKIPRESTINRAILDLNIQAEHSILKDDRFTIQLIRLAEPFVPPNSFKLDSLFFVINTAFDLSNSFLEIPITGMVQNWITQDVNNNGFIIRTGTPGRDVSRVAFFSAGIDSSLAPKVEVDYTVAPPIP